VKKRWICALLAVAMLITMLPGTAIRTTAANYNFTSSEEFIEILKTMEGFCRRATWDYKQHTVGYGTRCPDDRLEYYLNHDITEEEALDLLHQQLSGFESAVNKFIKK
jgi:GH24 family phage-related lysozyme (muramidase)